MITHLIFSGSNIYGIPFLGFIRYLYVHNLHLHIKNVAGTSFGSYIATIFALKIPVETFENLFIQYFNEPENNIISTSKTLNLIPKLGMETTYKYIKPLSKFIYDVYDSENITFLELSKKTGINLHINAYCINTQSEVIFNVDNTPDISIIDAIAASMALPILYQPVIINGLYYIDACFVNNVMLDYFPTIHKNNILSIIVKIPIDLHKSIPSHTKLDLSTIISIAFQSALQSIFKYSSDRHINNNSLIFDENVGIKIELNSKGILFNINTDLISKSILYGYHKTGLFFDNYYHTIGSCDSSCTIDVV